MTRDDFERVTALRAERSALLARGAEINAPTKYRAIRTDEEGAFDAILDRLRAVNAEIDAILAAADEIEAPDETNESDAAAEGRAHAVALAAARNRDPWH